MDGNFHQVGEVDEDAKRVVVGAEVWTSCIFGKKAVEPDVLDVRDEVAMGREELAENGPSSSTEGWVDVDVQTLEEEWFSLA
jgi:hypothetical protein